MNVTVLQVQIVVFQCPCAKTCRLQPPPDHLSERLRRRMRPGRDGNPRPIDPSVLTIDVPAGFHDSFQSN